MDEARPSVIIEFDDAPDGPEVPAPLPDEGKRRRRVTSLLVGTGLMVLVGAAVWGGAGSDAPATDAEPAAQTAEPTDAEQQRGTDVVRTLQDFEVAVQPVGSQFLNATRWDDDWIALRQPTLGSRLVVSSDGLDWTPLETSALRSSNLFGLDVVDGELRTMVNSAALNQQQFTLLTQASRDGIAWTQVAGAEPHRASGNRPTHVDLAFGTSVVVGDQPTTAETPPAELVAMLSTYVRPELAESTCGLRAVPTSPHGTFDLIGCDGSTLGRIGDDDPRTADMLATVAFLLRFENVISVQQDGAPLERLVLDPGIQIASIAATPTGFLAVAFETIGGLDPETRLLDDPPARLIQWRRESGLASLLDLTDHLDADVDLRDWFENELAISADGAATLATNDKVYRSDAPYREWRVVMTAPALSNQVNSTLHVGPDGEGMVFGDGAGNIWVGTSTRGWFRAPQLDGLTPASVLLADEDAVVAAFESGFDLVLAKASVTDLPQPLERTEPEPVRLADLRSVVEADDRFLAATADGTVATSIDGITWLRDPALSLRSERIRALGTLNGRVVSLSEATSDNGQLWANTYVLDGDRWVGAPGGLAPDAQRARMLLGASGTTTIELADVGAVSLVVTRSDIDRVHLSRADDEPFVLDIEPSQRVLDAANGPDGVYVLTNEEVLIVSITGDEINRLAIPLDLRLPNSSDLIFPEDKEFAINSPVARFNYVDDGWELQLPSGEVTPLEG